MERMHDLLLYREMIDTGWGFPVRYLRRGLDDPRKCTLAGQLLGVFPNRLDVNFPV